MDRTPPRTPFSTPFITSKKRLEERIRNIIAGPQKRPPLPLLALVLASCFFSVNLVSCQPPPAEEIPDSSTAPVQDTVPDEDAVLRMAEQVPDYFLEQLQARVLFSTTQGDKRLILFEETSQSHAGGFCNLIAGVWDDAAQEVSGEVYISRGDDGRWSSWTEGDDLHLLLTNYATYSGMETSSAPVWLRFADGVLDHPPCILPDAARETVPDLPDDAVFFDPMDPVDYWYDHKAVPVEGGLELYTAHEDWHPMSTPRARWRFTGLIPLSDTATFQPKSSTASESIRAILQGKAGFYYEAEFLGEPNTFLTIHDVPALMDPDDYYGTQIQDFAAADLDGDGKEEVILWVCGVANDAGGYLVLHQEDNTVYGYTAWYRSFQNLKTDGTYSYSAGGPLEGIVSKTTFTTSSLTTEPFAYSDFDGDWDNITYFVNNEQVTEEQFLAAFDRQNAKPDAEWYEFTDANIEAAFS